MNTSKYYLIFEIGDKFTSYGKISDEESIARIKKSGYYLVSNRVIIDHGFFMSSGFWDSIKLV